jgi:hypothetical protein
MPNILIFGAELLITCIPDFQAPPPIPKFIDTLEAMVRQAHHTVDELPSYDSFEPLVVSNVEPSPDDF